MTIGFRATTSVTEADIITALNTNPNIGAYDADAEPDIVTAPAGTYVERTISPPSSSFTVAAAASSSFAVDTGGAHFQDPDSFPASTSRIEFEIRMRVPTGTSLGTSRLFAQATDDVLFSMTVNAGNFDLFINRVEDTGGAALALGGTNNSDYGLFARPFDTMTTYGALVDLDGEIVRMYTGGSSDTGGTQTGTRTIAANTGAFQAGSSRRINVLRAQNNTNIVPAGVIIEWFRMRFYTSGSWGAWRGVGGSITTTPTGVNAATALASTWYEAGNVV